MKIISFGYEGKDNPYELLINQELRKLGVEVNVANRHGFLPITKALKKFGIPDIVHLHWLEPMWISPIPIKSPFKAISFLKELFLLKLLGVKIVWTVHNLTNHNRTQLVIENIVQNIVIKLTDQIICHSKTAKKILSNKFDHRVNSKIKIIDHHNYGDYYPNLISKKSAKSKLNLPKGKRIVLFSGTIRPYKGLEKVVDVFVNYDFKKLHLVLAGWADANYIKGLKKRINNSKNITLVNQKLTDKELSLYFSAAEVVVLPYNDILTSGSLLLAMNYAKPVVASESGNIKDLINLKGGFLVNQPQKWSKALEIIDQIDLKLLRAMGEYNRHQVKNLSPEQISQDLLDLYSKLID